MKLNYRLYYELQQSKHPFVLVGGISFVAFSLISLWIGGNPKPVLLLLNKTPSALEQLLFFALWLASDLFSGFLFGALFLTDDRCIQLISTRSALLIIISQLFSILSYPLFFACNAWLLSFIALLLALFFSSVSILVSYRITLIGTCILFVHFALLFWACIRVATIIFMN
jgi:hypothetical protein